MFIPLVDVLRCVRRPPHGETWLVATIDRADERDILEGVLGCPTCLAEYPIHGGVVYFTDPAGTVAPEPFRAPHEADAIRLAAALDLTDARMTAVLHGEWGAHAPIIRGLTPAHLLLVNPPSGVASGDGISIVRADVAPLARAAIDAVAFDATADDAMRASLGASVRAGGRLLAPVSVAVPPELTEVARDRDVWVARQESSGSLSAPIRPTRRPR